MVSLTSPKNLIFVKKDGMFYASKDIGQSETVLKISLTDQKKMPPSSLKNIKTINNKRLSSF